MHTQELQAQRLQAQHKLQQGQQQHCREQREQKEILQQQHLCEVRDEGLMCVFLCTVAAALVCETEFKIGQGQSTEIDTCKVGWGLSLSCLAI